MSAQRKETGRFPSPKRVAALLAVFAIACAVMSVDFYRDAKATAIANLSATQQIHARQASHGVRDFFDRWANTLSALGEMEGVADADPAGRRTLALFHQAHRQHLRSLTRVDEHGTILAAYPSEQSIGINIASQKHVAQILQSRTTVVSDVFRAVQGFDAVALHVPVFDGTRFRGSIAAVVDFQTLARAYFDDIRVGGTSHAFVVSRDGTLLYTPDRKLVGQPALQAFGGNGEMEQLFGNMMRGARGRTTYRLALGGEPSDRTKNFYAVYEPIRLGNTYWSVAVATSEADLLAGLNSFRDHLWIVIALVLVGGVISATAIVRSWLVVKEERDRRRAEEALRRSEERYRVLFEHSPQPKIVVDDATDGIVAANEAALRQFGCSLEKLTTSGVLEILAPEEHNRVAAARRLDKRELRRYSDLAFRRSDGSTFLADVASSAIVYDERPSRLVAIADVTDRVKAKRELGDAKWFNEELISSAGEGIVAVDRDLRVVVWNRSMEQLTRIPTIDALTRSATMLVPFVHDASEEALRNTLLTGERNSITFAADLAHGPHWLQQVSVPYHDRTGAIVGALAIISDITSRKQTEESLRSKEELLRSIFDATPSFVFSFDLDGRFISANRALCKALGFAERDLIGQRFDQMGLTEEQRASLVAISGEVVRTRQPVQFRRTLTLPSGRLITIEGTASPLCDADGNVVAISGITLDVSETLRAAESLDRLSQAVEQASEVILMTDRAGVITYVNPAFETVYGYTRDEALGQTPRILKSGLTSPLAYERFWQTILAGKRVRSEIVNKRADGTLVTVDRSVSPVINDAGEIVGFLSVQTDITERKRLEEERAALSGQVAELGKMQAIGTLAGGIAHDFNNLLAVILSFATVAERFRSDEKKFAKAIRTIRQAVGRGADLAKQVLTFARRVESTASAVDLNELLTETLKMVQSTFPRTIVVETSLAERLPPVIADETQLHQAFLNILINARDAMPQGGTIEVTTAVVEGCEVQRNFPEAGGGTHISVRLRDSGTGIPDEVRDRIFEPFFTTKELGRGTGLGLAVTYGAVKSAGGFIRVESALGCGTMFEVLIPVPEPWTASGDDTTEPVETLRGTESVLLVEDEPDLGPFMINALEEQGYTAVLARDGLEALDCLQGRQPPIDVIVSDNDLPRLSGSGLFAALRRDGNETPFILVSGFVGPEQLESLRRGGINEFLQKPYTADQLVLSIRTALKRSGRKPVPVRG